MPSPTLNAITKVKIEPNGSFKYVLVQVYENKDDLNSYVTIVRGTKLLKYHSDIFAAVQDELNPLHCKCIGGGKILHLPDDSTIKVHGTSEGFGKADHYVAAKIIQEDYSKYVVTVGDED